MENASVREMVHLVNAYANYRKHPCLENHSSLMNCLENFSEHIQGLERPKWADFSNPGI